MTRTTGRCWSLCAALALCGCAGADGTDAPPGTQSNDLPVSMTPETQQMQVAMPAAAPPTAPPTAGDGAPVPVTTNPTPVAPTPTNPVPGNPTPAEPTPTNPTPLMPPPAMPGPGETDPNPPATPDPGTMPAPAPTPVRVPDGAIAPIIPEPSGACPDFKTGTMMLNGLSANVEAGTPGATPGPLLFAWHGTGGTGALAMRQVPASVRQQITAQGGIIVAPSSTGQVRSGADVTFILGVWYDGADLDFADQVTACAVKNHNIDPRRIFVTGCSAGGLMTGTMAIKRSNYVAAAAPNSGGVAVPIGLAPQSPDRVPAVMTMHGGESDNVIVNFQDTSNNLIGILKPAGSFLVDCNHARGHCGAPTELHENAYEFMEAHPFGIGDSPYDSGLPADFPDYCEVQ